MPPFRINYPISVAILYTGGDGGDMEDTLDWVEDMGRTLKDMGHVVRILEVTSRNWRKAVWVTGDVVFNLVEDKEYDLYMKVARRLEELGRSQVGIGSSGLRYVVKKSQMKRKMQRVGIPTPNFRIFNRRSDILRSKKIEFPMIVKPSGQHAGVGICQDSVVIDKQELADRVAYLFKKFPGEVIAEEYIEGREMHVTVMGNGRHLVALPVAEITFGGEFKDNWNVYTYDAKWGKTSWEYWGARVVSPARIDDALNNKLEKTAIRAFREMGCRDIARFDIRVDDRARVYIVDINMCPSLNATDSEDATVRSAKALGWSYQELIENVIAITYKRVYGMLPDRIRDRRLLLRAI